MNASDLELVQAHGLSDVGRRRKHNEDSILVRPDLGLVVVADGMGGHNAGDVASKLAVASIVNFFEATQNEGFGYLPAAGEEGLDVAALRLVAAVRKANYDVYEISRTYPKHSGMGSTVVAAHVSAGPLVHVVHVGDSRCYRLRDGVLELLTEDHSAINEVRRLKPELSDERLRELIPKNVVTRGLGMESSVEPGIRTDAAQLGDVYLLCSDGLSGLVSDDLIAAILSQTPGLEQACRQLVDAANLAGGLDNISAVLLRIDVPGETEAIEIEADRAEPASVASMLAAVELPSTVIESVPPEADETSASPEVESCVHSVPPVALAQHCHACGAAWIRGARFCVECGAKPLAAETASLELLAAQVSEPEPPSVELLLHDVVEPDAGAAAELIAEDYDELLPEDVEAAEQPRSEPEAAELVADEMIDERCSSCGMPRIDDAAFCVECGARFGA